MTHEQPEDKQKNDDFERRLTEAREAYGEITGEELTGWRHLTRLWLQNVAAADPVVQLTAYTILGLIVLTVLKTTTAVYVCTTMVGALGLIAETLKRRGPDGQTSRRRGKNAAQSRAARKGARENGAAA